MSVLHETAEPMGLQEEEIVANGSADPDEETFHLQADGFWGEEKGFQDAEQLRKQLEQHDQRN
jgi:hypothetical protein